jgi:lipoprotein-anchoring transpeptidase ErfK/SrfK
VRRFLILVVLTLAGVGAAAPSAGRAPALVAPNVAVGGIFVGGLTSEQARARLRWAFNRPLRFVFDGRRWKVPRAVFGVQADVDEGVTRALAASPGTRLRLDVRADSARVREYARELTRRFSYPAEDAHAYLVGLTPAIAPAKPGREVREGVLEERISRALRSGVRATIRLPVRSVAATVTEASFGPIIVIRRGSNQLYLYDGTRLWRTFKVATGRAQYPTPLGSWSIVEKQRDPWWRPPNSDWAKGLKPIPPGPGNPLGTRWMGTSAPGVGIHGTPDAASVGYSASHGCIRMYVPDAEWLFEHVSIGTPVFIVAA